MKKFTLFAAFAALAVSASAQYTTTTPYVDQSVEAGKTQIFDLILGTDEVIAALEAAGQKVNDLRMNDDTRNLFIWPGGETFAGGDGSYPGVGYTDLAEGGYVCLDVTGFQGWSGAGFNLGDANQFSTMHWSDETRFHIAVRSTNAPVAVGFNIVDGKAADGAVSSPANVTLGSEPFVGDAGSFPVIGPRLTDEWQGIDISFADLKKVYPSFNYQKTTNWTGNILAFLAGGVAGQNLSMDALYFHTPYEGDAAVKGVESDTQFVVTSNTINVVNAQSIELYDLSGRLIKSANGSVLGISELGNGIYVAKSGNAVKKIMK